MHLERDNSRDAARLARYREYLDFYEGRQWTGRPLPGERRLTVNYARVLVRKLVSYIFPEPVSFSVVPDGATALAHERARRAEQALAAVYNENDLASVDFTAAVDAAVLGDGGFKVTWDGLANRPAVTAVDVQGLSAWWDVDDPRRVTRVVQRSTLPADEARARYGTAAGGPVVEVREDWRATTASEPGRFTLEVDGVVVRDGQNPLGFLPYVLFANAPRPRDFWGESDLADLLDVQRELNRRLSVVARILELSGNPIAVLENVDGADGIQVGPGALWELPEGAKAYLLDLLSGGGVGLHLQYIDHLYRALHDLAETPRTAFGDAGRNLSGAALEVEIQPLVQKVKRKRRVWESVFARRNALVLDLLARFSGLDLGECRRTVTLWGAILPADRDALVTQQVRLVTNGLSSRRAALARLGVEDPDRELRAMADDIPARPLEGGARANAAR